MESHPGKSSITWTAQYSGKEVKGTFPDFDADIDFDPATLVNSSVSIKIPMEKVKSTDTDAQSNLPESDWFAVKKYPMAIFSAYDFVHDEGDKYHADGTLFLRDKSLPVTLPFTLKTNVDSSKTPAALNAVVDGETIIKRTDFGVGQGDWAKTDAVADGVKVTVHLEAGESALMFTAFERMMAWRYLRARRVEGFISLITTFSIAGIALGVAALIVITSVMNGVKTEMLKHFIGWSGDISIYSTTGPLDHYDGVLDAIKHQQGVVNVTRVVEGQVMASASGRAMGAQVMALGYDDLANKHHIADKITSGSLDAFKSGDGIILGQRMAENLGVGIGDEVTLISPEGRQTIAGMVPRLKAYPVVATFKLGMNAFDSGMILMPLTEAQIYFKLADGENPAEAKSTYPDGGYPRISVLEVKLQNSDDAHAVAAKLREELGAGYRIYDWQESNKSVFEALTIQRNVMFIILTLIIIVAAFNIISSLVMLVKDKGRDIAILRTMGASRGSVLRIFFGCGAMIGMAGTAIGVVVGLLLAVNVDNIRIWIEHVSGGRILAEQLYFLSSLPAEIDPKQVLAVVAMSLGLSFLATIYPARRAARLEPAEALRYE